MAASSPTVAIIGAGPSGAAAAYALATRGIRAVLFERARHPRDKICGEGCTPRAVRNLSRMGVLSELQARAAVVTHAYLVSPGGIEMLADLPGSIHGGIALVIPRRELDARLAQRAVQAGAELREGVRVERLEWADDGVRIHFGRDKQMKADVVIGCDGMPSMVRKSLRAPVFGARSTAFAIRAIYDNVALPHAGALTLIWERSVLPAYGWVFPLPHGRANVGIGLRTHALRARPENLVELFNRFVSMPRVRAMLRGSTMVGRPLGHALPMTPSPGPTVFDRAVLAGDAAGFVNPLTGEGIEYALESGELAGLHVAQAASQGHFDRHALAPYAAACRKQFGRVLHLNGLLRWAFAVPWLLDRLFRAANHNEQTRTQLAEIALGAKHARLSPALLWAAIRGG